MEYYSQTSLDEYYTLDEHLEGETVGKVEGESVEQSIRGGLQNQPQSFMDAGTVA
jgi:hypothetical protein